jgi:hypothetical protein
MHSGLGWCQSTVPPAPPQQPATAGAASTGTIALPVIAEPQRVLPGDGRPVSINLFGQERDTFDQVAEARAAATPAPPLPSLPVRTAVAPLAVADAELLRQAGIVTASRIGVPGRLTVERVMPNSAAFAAGVRAGDVISHIDRTMLAVSTVPGQTVAGGTSRIGIDIDRSGQSSRLVLNVGEPLVRRTLPPIVNAPIVNQPVVNPPIANQPIVNPPILRSVAAPAVTPSGRVIENGPIVPANGPLDHPTIARSKVLAPGSGSTTGSGVGGTGDTPQGPGTPGLGSAPAEGGGSAAMRTGRNAPVKPGQTYGTGRLY